MIFVGSGLILFSLVIVVMVNFGIVGKSQHFFLFNIDNSNSNEKSNSFASAPQEQNNNDIDFVAVQSNPQCAQLTQQNPQPSGSSLPKLRDSALKVELVANGLTHSTSMAFVDRCTILALQKDDGKVIMITANPDGKVQQVPILQLRVENASERGLLGIAVANDNGSSSSNSSSTEAKKVFLYLTENDNGQVRNGIYSYDWTGISKSLTNKKLLLDLPGTPGPNHDGGKMVIGKDGRSLYAVIGNLNHRGVLQNIKDGPSPDDTGVIFRVNPADGSALGDNPFITASSSSSSSSSFGVAEERLGRYFAYGIRNSFGLAIDPVTGNLWQTENGPTSYDEINLVKPGFNSGWQQVKGPIDRTGKSNSDLVQLQGSHYADPVFSWKEEVAPTAIEFLNSKLLGEKYANNIFVGDFLNGNLYYFEVNATRTGMTLTGDVADRVADTPTENAAITFGTGFRGGITDIQTGPDGLLYVLTMDGRIYQIAPQS